MRAHPALLHYYPEGFGIDLEELRCAMHVSVNVSAYRNQGVNLKRGTIGAVLRACPAGLEEVAIWRNDPQRGPVVEPPIITKDYV